MLLNLRKHKKPDYAKIYLYIRDPVKPTYQLELKNFKEFVDYSKTIDDIYQNLDYNPTKKKSVDSI